MAPSVTMYRPTSLAASMVPMNAAPSATAPTPVSASAAATAALAPPRVSAEE